MVTSTLHIFCHNKKKNLSIILSVCHNEKTKQNKKTNKKHKQNFYHCGNLNYLEQYTLFTFLLMLKFNTVKIFK